MELSISTQSVESSKEYVSEMEKIRPAIELHFNPDSAFGNYRVLMKHAVSHPAKMPTGLAEFLIKKYTKQSETILDPFAGAGTTLVLGSLLGRNTVGVELEPRFVKFVEKTKENMANIFGENGSIEIIQGDSRKLTSILSAWGADAIVSSPHYEDMNDGKRFQYKLNDTMLRNGRDQSVKAYDSVITSPPYENTDLAGGDPERRRENMIKSGYSKAQIRDVIHKSSNALINKYDAVVTSPPFENMNNDNRAERLELQRGLDSSRAALGQAYSISAAITSPPYSDSGQMSDPQWLVDHRNDPALRSNGSNKRNYEKNLVPYRNENKNQIGNLKKDHYLQAVKKVYEETYSVLKPGGYCIVVIKPFQRQGKIIDLPLQTWKILEAIGFKLEEVYKMRLNSLSFWRILQYRKNKEIAQLWHEYALVARK